MAGVFQIAICKLSYQTTKLMVEIDELNFLQIAILVQVAMFVLDQEILKFAIFFVPKFSQICKQHISLF